MQSFISGCLKRLVKVFWPEVVSSTRQVSFTHKKTHRQKMDVTRANTQKTQHSNATEPNGVKMKRLTQDYMEKRTALRDRER